jgi:hypothetical protein
LPPNSNRTPSAANKPQINGDPDIVHTFEPQPERIFGAEKWGQSDMPENGTLNDENLF